MAILINYTTIDSPSTSAGPRTSPAVDMTGANLIVFTLINDFGALNNPSDSQGNSYSNPGGSMTDPGLGSKGGLVYKINPSVSSSMTFTIGDGHGSGVIYGFKTAVSFDKLNTASSSTNTNTLTSNSVTPTTAPCLIIAPCSKGGPTGSMASVDQGFTILGDMPWYSGGQYGLTGTYKAQTSSPASQNPTFTTTNAPTSGLFLVSQSYVFSMTADGIPFCQILG